MENQTARSVTRTTDENLRLSDLLVNIGQAEVEATLPTCSQATQELYKQIKEKEAMLKKMKNAYNKLIAGNQKTEENIEDLIRKERELKKSTDELEKQRIEKEKEIALAQKSVSKQSDEVMELEKLIEESKQRQAIFEVQAKKQQENLESAQNQLDEQVGEKYQLKQRLNALVDTETTLENAIQADKKTIKDLTSYLQTLTQSLYEKQREVDRSKLKQLETQTQVRLLHNALRGIQQNQSDLQQRFHSGFGHLQPNYGSKPERDENGVEVDEDDFKLNEQISHLKNSINENKKRLNHITSTNENWINQLLIMFDELQESQMYESEIKAREKVLKNREKREKIKEMILSYEPKPTLYKEFQKMLSKAEKLAAGEETGSIEEIVIKRQQELEESQKKLDQVSSEIEESKQKLKSSFGKTVKSIPSSRESYHSFKNMPKLILNVSIPRENSQTSLKSAKSLPSLVSVQSSLKKSQSSTKLSDLSRERDHIIEQEIRKASLETNEEKKLLTDEIGLLNLEVRSYESEINHLKNEIQKLTEERSTLQSEVQSKTTELEKEELKAQEEIKQVKERHKNKISEMTVEIEKAREDMNQVEQEKNLLSGELRQAKVDEDNWRNRYNTYRSWKLNNNSGLKKLEHSQQQLEIEKSMNADVEKELDGLKKLLMIAQERNHVTQESLATLKPYYEEVAEFKTLLHQRSQLLHELNQLQKQLKGMDRKKNDSASI